MDMKDKSFYRAQTFQEMILMSQQQKNEMCRNQFKMNLQSFYMKMVIQKIVRYKKICEIYKKYRYYQSLLQPNLEQIKLISFDWIKIDSFVSSQQLMSMYSEAQNQNEVFMMIYQQSQMIVANARYVWSRLLDIIVTMHFGLIDQLANKQITDLKQITGFQKMVHSQISSQTRQQRRLMFIKKRQEILSVMDVYEDSDLHHPFLMIQNFDQSADTSSGARNNEVQSLIVMIHGYQGSSLDMQKGRNFLNMYNPHCYALLVKSIQEIIDNSIQSLGLALAKQVKQHILSSQHIYKKINFLGYSLGGIVARQAIKYLSQYKDKLNIFISFASPHAGICDTSNILVMTGIWFLTNFKKCKNLKQLNCQIVDDSNQITLQKLSSCQSINWFKKFIVVSSKQDDFVPYESSRLQSNSLKQKTKKICQNLVKNIKRLERVEVWFDTDHIPGTLDKMTGRKAHIQFLENRLFLDSFFSVYAKIL